MRPFCIATIGAILGIIMGLYIESIVPFVIISIFLIILFNVLNYGKARKYNKVIYIFFICFFSFWGYTFILENNYNKINQTYNKQEIEIKAIVVSDKVEKEYKDVYQIQVIEIRAKENSNETEKEQKEIDKISNNEQYQQNQKKKCTKFKMLLNVKRNKNTKLELQYGDEISFTATYEVPSTARNDGGFDYRQYLKTKKIIGITSVKPSVINIIDKNKTSIIEKVIHDIKNISVAKIKEILPKDTANLCTGLLLGEKTELSEDIQEDFRKSNLSHILAISGAHVSYILLGVTKVIQKLKLHKRWSKIFIIIFLIFFMALVGFTPSVTRACIMAILQLLAGILFKKSDTYQNLAISSFIILLVNPYSLLDIGFQLSFGGTIGIILFSKRIVDKKNTEKITNNEYDKEKQTKKNDISVYQLLQKAIKSIKELCSVTLSANLIIIPIMMYHFNTFSLTFLISNLLASPILGISIILSMIFLIALLICKPIAKFISIFLQSILQLLIKIAQLSSKLPFSQILVPTPALWQIILYYIILILIFFVKSNTKEKLNEIKLSKTNQEVQNIQSIKIAKNIETKQKIEFSKVIKHKSQILILLIFIIIFPYFFQIFPNNKLTIHFIDVGQGDSMLIQTPSRKTILIDGGGSETGSFDVGEKTLLPYLLDKSIMKIDYMIFSHFDSDHCQGLFTIMEKLKVEIAIVSKQGKESENYEQFLEIATKRKIKIIVVQAGDKIQIDKNCTISILFPEKDLIGSNILNNNSIVAKFSYTTKNSQEFSLLLTGDVEEIAEKKLIEEYQNTNELQAMILKVAHHRLKNLLDNRIFKFGNTQNCFNWSRRKEHFWTSKSNNIG